MQRGLVHQVAQMLQQYGFAVLPQTADAAVLDAMRFESTALLELAETAGCDAEYFGGGCSVAERM